VITADDIRPLVKRFDPGEDSRAAQSREAVLALLAEPGAPCARSRFGPGHVTASGLVLTETGDRVLLVHHQQLRRWLQPGGHVEPSDATVVEAARREVLEETGIQVDGRTEPALVGVDVHDIPPARGEPAHRHHDLMFRFVAPGREPVPGAGVLRAAWVPVDRLEDFDVDDPLHRAVDRALRLHTQRRGSR
jgi:8-oxo-dGTP pyrophosphatase MutT (NUDIX family)